MFFLIVVPKISFASDVFEVYQNESSVNVEVTRGGDLGGSGSFFIKASQIYSEDASLCKL